MDLLVTLSSPHNVETITTRMMHTLRHASDQNLKRHVIHSILQCAGACAPTRIWYTIKMVRLLVLGRELVPADVIHNIMSIVSQGEEEEEEGEGGVERARARTRRLRREVIEETVRCVDLLGIATSPLLTRLMVWMIGFYGTAILSPSLTLKDLIHRMLHILDHPLDQATRYLTIRGVIHLACLSAEEDDVSKVKREVKKFCESSSADVQQMSWEFGQILTSSISLNLKSLGDSGWCAALTFSSLYNSFLNFLYYIY